MSINIKYATNIKNSAWDWNAFIKSKFAKFTANVVPLHDGQSMPNFSFITHFGIRYTISDFKQINDIKRKNIINICIKINFLYCFFIVFTFWLYIILYNIVKYLTNILLQIFIIYSKLILLVNRVI